MVFVDLDDEFPGLEPFQLKVDPDSESAALPPSPALSETHSQTLNRSGFSAALSCYPYVFIACGTWNAGGNETDQMHPIASSKRSLERST